MDDCRQGYFAQRDAGQLCILNATHGLAIRTFATRSTAMQCRAQDPRGGDAALCNALHRNRSSRLSL